MKYYELCLIQTSGWVEALKKRMVEEVFTRIYNSRMQKIIMSEKYLFSILSSRRHYCCYYCFPYFLKGDREYVHRVEKFMASSEPSTASESGAAVGDSLDREDGVGSLSRRDIPDDNLFKIQRRRFQV